jgi:hypothetical protein
MYVRKEGQCVSALQNICVFQYCASFWYHDPCTYVVAARVLPNRLSEQDLKQVTQRNHRVAVVGGNDFLQTEKSFTKRKACLSRESKDRKNNKLKVHMRVDVGLWMFLSNQTQAEACFGQWNAEQHWSKRSSTYLY